MKSQTENKKKTEHSKIWLIIVPIILFLLILAITIPYSILHVTADSVVGSVNGSNIYAGEIKLKMNALKTDAIEYFEEKYGAEINTEFWDKDFDGQTPAQYLRNLALEEIKSYKLQMQLAKKYGVSNELSYKGLIDEITSINVANSEKIAQGIAVYGQSSYNLTTYFEYKLSNMQLDLQKKMSEKNAPLYADDTAYKAYYEKHKDTNYKKIDSCTFILLSEAISDDTTANAARKELEAAKDLLDKSKDKKSTVEQLKKQFKNITSLEVNLDNDNYSQLAKQNTEIYNAVNELGLNKTSDVFQSAQELKLAVCTKRQDMGYEKFEDVKSTLEAQYAQTAYGEYVSELCAKHKAETNFKFDKIPVKEALN